MSRSEWTLVTPIHVAATREQALAEVVAGGDHWLRGYYNDTAGFPAMFPDESGKSSYLNMIDARSAFVGTPDEVAESIEWLWELTGGFGCLLILENSAASPAARHSSYQLFAREVAPRFTGELDQLVASQRRAVVAREEGYARRVAAQEQAHAKLADRDGARMSGSGE